MNKKKIWILTGSIILFFLVAMYVSYDNIWSKVFAQQRAAVTMEDSGNYLGETKTLELQEGDVLAQKVQMVSENFTGFAVKFSKQSKMDGNIKIALLDKNNKEIGQWNLDSKELVESEYYSVLFEKAKKTKIGEKYTIEIIPQLSEGDSVRIELTQPTMLTGKVDLNGTENDLSIAYKLYDGILSSLKYLFLAFVFAGVVSTIVLALILQSKSERKVMLSFVVLAFFIGSMYIFALPPFSVPDEGSHIATVYAKSSKLLGKEATNSDGRVIADPDMGIFYISEEYPTKSTYAQYFKGAFGKTEDIVNETISLRSPLSAKTIGYVPQVLGVSFARTLGLNGEQILLLGRLFALLWYCVIMGIVINIVPVKKMVFFVVGLMPMTIQQVASFSYDSVLLGFCFLLTAYLLYLIFQKDKVTWQDALIVTVLSIGIGSIKYIYLPILGLLFFVPKEKFGSKHKKNKAIRCEALLLIGGFGISKMTMLVQAAEVGKLRADGLGQYTIKYVFENLGGTIIVVVRTVFDRISFYIESMIASPLGWVEIELPGVILFGFIILLLLCGLSDRGKYRFSENEKRVCYLLVLVMNGLVLAAMLVSYTYIGSDIILGVQGRYFVPALPLVLCAMDSEYVTLKRNIDAEMMLAVQGLQLYAIWAITSTVVSR